MRSGEVGIEAHWKDSRESPRGKVVGDANLKLFKLHSWRAKGVTGTSGKEREPLETRRRL